jgi:hypothetical protein
LLKFLIVLKFIYIKLAILTIFCLFFVFGSIGGWTQGLVLARQVSATPPALFHVWYFQHSISQTVCLGWPWTEILLIAASRVARITGVSHQHLATSAE